MIRLRTKCTFAMEADHHSVFFQPVDAVERQ
jgi:hypothetical protein